MTERDERSPAGPGIADQRRGQMLRAALDVISERGFADTRIADIAERIGISPALVIYYFKTKDQLLTEAIRHYEDAWYAEGQRRMEKLSTAAERLEEFVAMNLLPDEDPELEANWKLWLDFWVQAARDPDVAGVRQEFDRRWREVVTSLVAQGQQTGEFADVDPHPFSIFLCAVLDGLAIQIALEDPVVDPMSAYDLCMRYAADHLGFRWVPGGGARGNARGNGSLLGPGAGSRLGPGAGSPPGPDEGSPLPQDPGNLQPAGRGNLQPAGPGDLLPASPGSPLPLEQEGEP